jgi:hypothetical protein
MTWNWQQPDWPRFLWDRPRLETAEKQFLLSGGVFVGTVRHLGNEERDQLTIEAMSGEAVTTSEIEGEILDRASVQSSICKQLGLAIDQRRVRPTNRTPALGLRFKLIPVQANCDPLLHIIQFDLLHPGILRISCDRVAATWQPVLPIPRGSSCRGQP